MRPEYFMNNNLIYLYEAHCTIFGQFMTNLFLI